jgi:hypothetical protein
MRSTLSNSFGPQSGWDLSSSSLDVLVGHGTRANETLGVARAAEKVHADEVREGLRIRRESLQLQESISGLKIINLSDECEAGVANGSVTSSGNDGASSSVTDDIPLDRRDAASTSVEEVTFLASRLSAANLFSSSEAGTSTTTPSYTWTGDGLTSSLPSQILSNVRATHSSTTNSIMVDPEHLLWTQHIIPRTAHSLNTSMAGPDGVSTSNPGSSENINTDEELPTPSAYLAQPAEFDEIAASGPSAPRGAVSSAGLDILDVDVPIITRAAWVPEAAE